MSYAFLLPCLSHSAQALYRRHPDTAVPIFRGAHWFWIQHTSRYMEHSLHGERLHWQLSRCIRMNLNGVFSCVYDDCVVSAGLWTCHWGLFVWTTFWGRLFQGWRYCWDFLFLSILSFIQCTVFHKCAVLILSTRFSGIIWNVYW